MDISSGLISSIANLMREVVKYAHGERSEKLIISETALQNHVQAIESWTSRIQVLGLSEPLAVDTDTLSLDISSQPRRFSRQAKEKVFTEDDILSSRFNFVILGGPGSGKKIDTSNYLSYRGCGPEGAAFGFGKRTKKRRVFA